MRFASTYAQEKPNVDPHLEADDEPDEVPTTFAPAEAPAKRTRRCRSGVRSAPVKLDETYVTPAETHNPIELHATTAVWDGSTLTLYEASQGVVNLQIVLAQMFGLPKENVRVITKFVGSGFGSKLWPWPHCALAAAAARQLGKPVKLVLSRKMMFQTVGHRPRTQQRVRLGATPDGKLVSLQHDYVYHHVDPRRLSRRLRRNDGVHVTVCRTFASRSAARSAISAPDAACAAPARCPASMRPNPP